MPPNWHDSRSATAFSDLDHCQYVGCDLDSSFQKYFVIHTYDVNNAQPFYKPEIEQTTAINRKLQEDLEWEGNKKK